MAKQVKEAARPDLRALAQEAGFRLARGRTYNCPFHRDRTPSAHLYEDRVHCFSCNRTFDEIDLAGMITGGSDGDGIRLLALRYGISCDVPHKPRPPRTSESTYLSADLFRIGFCWQLERYLDLLKQAWALDDSFIDGGRIFRSTRLLTLAQHWTANESATFYLAFHRTQPGFVAHSIAEAERSQIQLASIIAYAASSSKKVVAA
jgi:hypothetical protein